MVEYSPATRVTRVQFPVDAYFFLFRFKITIIKMEFLQLTRKGKERFYLTTHSTHFLNLRLYGVRHMVNDQSDSERGNPLPTHGLLFSIDSKGSFICTIPQTG